MKELERVGIPAAQIATITPISEAVGAVRIVGAVAIPHPVGAPELEPEKEYELRMSIVRKALDAISSDVNVRA